ncbi:MAG: biotin synthase BioB, partial [Treponemataceae bacterium]|nr:biotin synthase BioB [Treponemataceae bacterium]
MKPLELADEIIRGKRLSRNDDLNFFAEADLEELCAGADKIRKALCGDFVELCSVINGRAGACGENCKFCAQSSHNGAGVEKHGFLEKEVILEDCKRHEAKGVHRYSIVTAGKSIGGDLKKECDAYKLLSEKCKIELCASNGLLSRKDFAALYESGVR